MTNESEQKEVFGVEAGEAFVTDDEIEPLSKERDELSEAERKPSVGNVELVLLGFSRELLLVGGGFIGSGPGQGRFLVLRGLSNILSSRGDDPDLL